MSRNRRRRVCEDDEDGVADAGDAVREPPSIDALDRGCRILRSALVDGKSIFAVAAEMDMEPEAALVLLTEVHRSLEGLIVVSSRHFDERLMKSTIAECLQLDK